MDFIAYNFDGLVQVEASLTDPKFPLPMIFPNL